MISALVRARDAALTLILLPLLAPLWLLPWRMALALGRGYGYLAWAACAYPRRVGMINLRRATPGPLSAREARRAMRIVFGNIGQSIAEGIQFARRFKHAPQAMQSLYECDDPALERRILADERPRIFVIGHFGSWELAVMIAFARSRRPGAAIFRALDNTFLNAIWRRWRLVGDAEWIDKDGGASAAVARLRRGHDVAMLLDENAGPRGVFVPFFGTLASTRKTPAVLSLATGAPIVIGACVRRPGRPYLFRLAMVEADRRLAPDDAIRDLTGRIVSTYEAWIRQAPLQWRWIHWRWKARPDGTDEQYGRAELRRAFAERITDGTLVTEPPDRC